MRAFIDRIESEIATVKLGEEETLTLEVPLGWLPPGVCEGTVLQLHWEIDREGTQRAKAAVQELLNALQTES